MDGITSNWRLTIDPAVTPVVILDYADKMPAEPDFGKSEAAIVEDLVRSDTPFLDTARNRVHSITFARLLDSATDALSRQAMMLELLAASAEDPKPLKLEISGITDRHWLFSGCVVTELKPGRYLFSAKPRRMVSYQITAVGMSQVGP